MPYAAARPCAQRPCPNLVTGQERYCPTHKTERAAIDNDRRGSAASRGYGARWRQLRYQFLQTNPLCCDPYHVHGASPVVATVADHITPKRRGGRDAWDNLQSLCATCHSRKTASEDGGFGNKRVVNQ